MSFVNIENTAAALTPKRIRSESDLGPLDRSSSSRPSPPMPGFRMLQSRFGYIWQPSLVSVSGRSVVGVAT